MKVQLHCETLSTFMRQLFKDFFLCLKCVTGCLKCVTIVA